MSQLAILLITWRDSIKFRVGLLNLAAGKKKPELRTTQAVLGSCICINKRDVVRCSHLHRRYRAAYGRLMFRSAITLHRYD